MGVGRLLSISVIILLAMQVALVANAQPADNTGKYTVSIPNDVEPGLYDLHIVLDNGEEIWLPRSVWVLEPGRTQYTFAHISDLHFLGVEDWKNNLRFVGILLTQLLGVDFIIDTGDEADTASTNQYIESRGYHWAFNYPIPLLLIPGNHDYGSDNWEKYIGVREWYRVIGGKILVVGIDTRGEGIPAESSMEWLENVLAEHSDLPVKIVLMHHPVFYWQGPLQLTYTSPHLQDPRSYPSSPLSYYWGADPDMARRLIRIVEDYNVTMVLSGHIHRDQCTLFKSIRTGTTTYFITTTTLAQSRPNYNGLQVITLRDNGNFTFPYPPPTFIGCGLNSTYRDVVYNSIPDDPKWDIGYYYGEFVEGDTAYVIRLTNNLYTNISSFNIENNVVLALPWIGGNVSFKVLSSEGGASADLLDYRVEDSPLGGKMLYTLLNIDTPSNSSLEFVIYMEEDHTPPAAVFQMSVPEPPRLNRTNKLYFQVSDVGWGIRSVEAYLLDNGVWEPLKVTKAKGSSYIVSVRVKDKQGVNRTIKLVATDLAGNVYEQNYTFTFYPRGETGRYYYGPNATELPESPVKLPRLEQYFTEQLPQMSIGPGAPLIVYPGDTGVIELYGNFSANIESAYITTVMEEDGSLRLLRYDIGITHYTPGQSTTQPTTTEPTPSTTPETTTTPTQQTTTQPSTTPSTSSPTTGTTPTETTTTPAGPDYTLVTIAIVLVVIIAAAAVVLVERRK